MLHSFPGMRRLVHTLIKTLCHAGSDWIDFPVD